MCEYPGIICESNDEEYPVYVEWLNGNVIIYGKYHVSGSQFPFKGL